MDLRRLRYFLVVAEELHFQRAAARIPMAQSSLSEQIARLERELATSLFVRRARTCELTEAGARLVPEARRLIAQVDGLADQISARPSRHRPNRVPFVVGCNEEGIAELTPVVIEVFAAARPDLDVVVKPLSYQAVTQAVGEGIVDAVLGAASCHAPDDPAFRALYADEAVLLAPTRLFAGQDAVAGTDAAELTFVDDPDLPAHFCSPFQLGSLRNGEEGRRASSTLTSTRDVADLVISGRAVVATPRSAERNVNTPDLSFVRLTDVPDFVLGVKIPERPNTTQRAFVEVASALATHCLDLVPNARPAPA